MMQRLLRLLFTGLLPLAATGCLHIQLGGAVAESTVIVTPLRDPSNTIQQLQIPSLEETRQDDGPERWDSRTDLARFVFLGNVFVDRSLYEEDELYLVTVSGGVDLDADSDNALDQDATAITGTWHAILSGDQLSAGRVSPLTEAVYRYLEFNLDSLSDFEVRSEMDVLAGAMVGDVNRSGDVDYQDVVAWHRHFNENTYLRDLSPVDELASAIRASASSSTLRELSLVVVGRDPDSAGPYTVSGNVLVPATTRVDSDVNDVNNDIVVVRNNSISRAQAIINPVVLGGYVNRPGQGEPGRSSVLGDIDDYFQVELLQGQVISLLIAEDPAFNDLDLFLYDSAGTLIDGSLDFTELEQLTVPEDGEYFIRVNAFLGASNYQLRVGIGEQITATGRRYHLSDDFVPGQLIASFNQQRKVSTLSRRARFTGMRIRGGGLRRANLLEMQAEPGESRLAGKLRTLRKMKRLKRRAEVKDAGLNYYVQATAIPDDPFYNQQRWHYEMINLPLAWEEPLRGENVIVAVLDTGIRRNHPDFAGQLVSGWDFFDDDSNPEDPGDGQGGAPSSFHGTHVAGTVAAASNNDRGVAGVAWNAQVMPIRVLGPGGGTSFDVLQGVRFAAGLENDSGTLPARRADVINMSLAGGGFSSFDQAVYDVVSESGVIIVAAAGNDATSQFAYPASYDGVISVSAVNINRARASYSNFGSRVDVAAPGGDGFTNDVNGDGIADLVLSTAADDSTGVIRDVYGLLQGTSMASPHVAGVAALMKAIYPALTHSEFENLLALGLITDDLGSAGRDNTYGWGLINANKAVLVAESLAAGGDIANRPTISTSVTALNFGTFATSLPLTISNAGTGELVIDQVEVVGQTPWLSVTPTQVDPQTGTGSYTVSVDREQLEIGSYSANIRITSNDINNRVPTVEIIVQQPDPSLLTGGNAGLHYVLLIDSITGAVFQEDAVLAEDGIYPFTFTDVPPGNYQIIAGSDSDNDFFICDPGEACGAWPVLDSQLPIIEIFQNITGLRFSSTYNTGIISTESTSQPAPQPLPPLRRSAYPSERRPR
ncbi:MAG: S8 family serine peptidase [Halieaceae bacterium]|jgi:serine protease|nr:S8 family serine peptidase [Halieaceae bacterium]